MDLTSEEHQMLERAAAGGGLLNIRDQSPAYMQHAAHMAQALESMGLFNTIAHEIDGGNRVDLVTVELTRAGRRYLAEQE